MLKRTQTVGTERWLRCRQTLSARWLVQRTMLEQQADAERVKGALAHHEAENIITSVSITLMHITGRATTVWCGADAYCERLGAGGEHARPPGHLRVVAPERCRPAADQRQGGQGGRCVAVRDVLPRSLPPSQQGFSFRRGVVVEAEAVLIGLVAEARA